MAQIVVAPKTTAQIQAYAEQFKCCAADKAYSIANDISKGVEVCECEQKDLMYLVYASEILANYVPIGGTAFAGMPSVVGFIVTDNGATSGTATLTVGTTVVWNDVAAIYGSVSLMLQGMIDNALSGWVITKAPYGIGQYVVIIKSATSGFFGQQDVTLSFYSEALKLPQLYTGVMNGGQFLQTADTVCLTSDEVQQIIENCLKLCGCDCITNDDNV